MNTIYVLAEDGTARPQDADNPQLGWLSISANGLRLAQRWAQDNGLICQHGDCHAVDLPANVIVCALRVRERWHVQHIERLGAFCTFHASELTDGFFCGRPVMLIPTYGGENGTG